MMWPMSSSNYENDPEASEKIAGINMSSFTCQVEIIIPFHFCTLSKF
jgi:hypothetical protein